MRPDAHVADFDHGSTSPRTTIIQSPSRSNCRQMPRRHGPGQCADRLREYPQVVVCRITPRPAHRGSYGRAKPCRGRGGIATTTDWRSQDDIGSTIGRPLQQPTTHESLKRFGNPISRLQQNSAKVVLVWKRQRRFSIDRTDTNIGAWSVFDWLQ
jgi:hypothetical protein